jgi:sec-independent protein translocase protein TatA
VYLSSFQKEKRTTVYFRFRRTGKQISGFYMHTLALGFGNFGGPDLIIILGIVLVLFGAKKLPELARGLGQSLNEFRKTREEFDRELHSASNELKSQPQTYQPNQPAIQTPQPPPVK